MNYNRVIVVWLHTHDPIIEHWALSTEHKETLLCIVKKSKAVMTIKRYEDSMSDCIDWIDRQVHSAYTSVRHTYLFSWFWWLLSLFYYTCVCEIWDSMNCSDFACHRNLNAWMKNSSEQIVLNCDDVWCVILRL